MIISMELAYFYEEKLDKDVSAILNEDSFIGVGHTVMESDILHIRKSKGYFLYIKGNKEEINLLDKKLKDLGVEKLYGDDEKAILDIFNIGMTFS